MSAAETKASPGASTQNGNPPAAMPKTHDLGDREFMDDVKKMSDHYNLNPEDGEVFNARTIDHEPTLDPDQVSSAIPGTGFKNELGNPYNCEVADETQPSKYLPHITGPRQSVMPSGVRGGDTQEAPMYQEGASGRGPGMHEQNLSNIPVEGQGPNDPSYMADGTPRRYPDGTPRPVTSNEPYQKDELGRTTRKMPGVKEEEPPGPRTDICLAPRIVHLQVCL